MEDAEPQVKDWRFRLAFEDDTGNAWWHPQPCTGPIICGEPKVPKEAPCPLTRGICLESYEGPNSLMKGYWALLVASI